MTALLELKQKIKEIYGQYEMYILPVMRFVLALVYFLGSMRIWDICLA